MEPVAFEGHNVILGKDQPEYRPLPAFHSPDGQVITCWRLTGEELMQVLQTGRIWMSQFTFGRPFQPVSLSVDTLVRRRDETV